MKKQAVSYAIIRFQPHVETEEFANIGIVLVAPRTNYLDFRLETRRLGRLTDFFDSLEPATIRSVLRNCNAELKRITDLAARTRDGHSRVEVSATDTVDHLFRALTKDREGIIRFSDVRFAMTDDPREHLDALFDRTIRRNFASSVYRERLLERHVGDALRLEKVGRTFRRMAFTDGLYSASFPFVAIMDDKPQTVLKPIFLGQDDPTRILDHGNKWLFTINRLRGTLPPDVVFAVEGPGGSSLRHKAFRETVDQFKANDITVVDGRDERELLDAVYDGAVDSGVGGS